MTEGRYVRFDPKTDNSNEIISATHINSLQDTSERTQQGIFRAQDRDFLDKALFVLEHHRVLNGMWIDLFENTSKIDLPKSTHLVFSEVEQAIAFPNDSIATEGFLYSRPYINPDSDNMKKVMVICAGYVPTNTSILIEISNNNADWFEVPLSDSELFEMPTEGSRLQLRAKLNRTNTDVSPRLDAWTILFRDPKNEVIKMPDGSDLVIKPPVNPDGGGDLGGIVKLMHHQLMGIGPNDHHEKEHKHDGVDGSGTISHNVLTEVGPDDHHPKSHFHGQDGIPYVRLDQDVSGTLPLENLSYQIWTGKPGTTGLYFDPNIDDKLVYVKTPDDETYLFYDLVADRLDHTITITQGIAIWEQMVFGNYTNGSGEETVVLNGTEKTHYDAMDSVIVREVQRIAAPSLPTGLLVMNPGTGIALDLAWVPNTEIDLVGYNVYQTTNAGITWILKNTNGLVPTAAFVATGLVNNADYGYAVTAVDMTGYESGKSTMVHGRPTLLDTTAPDQVQGVVVDRVLSGELVVSWDPNHATDLANYRIWSSPTGAIGSFFMAHTAQAGAEDFTHTNLVTGASYYYYVTAVDSNGNESVPSIVVSQNA